MKQNLIINPELKALIPPLLPDELAQLKANILKDGIREPIVTWNGTIVDGHNRYAIAEEFELPFETKAIEFESLDACKEWMILNQFGRRNISNYQRSVLALELEQVFRDKAKANQAIQYKGSSLPLKSAEVKPIETRQELAKLANVGHDTISKVKVIQAKATPEIKSQLETGEVSINQAYQQIKKEEKIEKRKIEIEAQKKDIEEGNVIAVSGLYDVISIDPPWPYGREYDPENSRVANPYPEMSIEQIQNIELPATDNSVLFLWTTHAFLPHSFELLKNWGFTYKATMVWNKQKIGMGAWFRMQCEFCLVGIKGKPIWQNTTYSELINESRREHSRKPEAFFELVNKICFGRKLEYFSREARDGWDIYGNDINKYNGL